MTQEMQFKTIAAQYCSVKPEDMTDDMRFREDLGFSSLIFMSFLGELEDYLRRWSWRRKEVAQVLTVAEALALLEKITGGIKEMLIRDILEESGRNYAEIPAIKWLKKKEYRR